MISFRETLDSISRLVELLRTASEAETTFRRSVASLTDLQTILDRVRVRSFNTPAEMAEYIERVAIPQLHGIRDTLDVTTAAHFSKMRTAAELASRLELRLQALAEGSVDGL